MNTLTYQDYQRTIIWMKANELRTLIASKLSAYNSYFGDNVGEYEDYEYKVNYQINNTLFADRAKFYFVDFDVYSHDSILVDEITDEIEIIFTNITHQLNDSRATFYYQNRYNVDDKNTYRRTLSFEVHTYDSEFE